MDIPPEAINEFKEIYREEFGEELSDEEAYETGRNLISLFEIICRPIPQDNKEYLKNKINQDIKPL